MNNYESRELLNMPMPKRFDKMTDEELANYLTGSYNYNILIPMLIEANRRKDTVIKELNRRITRLEEKALIKRGRKRQTYFYEGEELTDEKLVYLIDYEYYDSISKLEKLVGAKKNVLRSRYKKAKNKQKIERELEDHGDC